MDRSDRRKPTEIIETIYENIKQSPGITMSQLERKIGTNPLGLREYCQTLQKFGLIKIEKTDKTTILRPKQH